MTYEQWLESLAEISALSDQATREEARLTRWRRLSKRGRKRLKKVLQRLGIIGESLLVISGPADAER